ncbi:recombinase family protein [Rhodoglobus sp.]
MDIGYARVSTAKQDLDRQLDALGAIGIPSGRIYVDKKSGATTNRPGLSNPGFVGSVRLCPGSWGGWVCHFSG